MMGMAITRTDIPVTKGTSGVLVLGEEAVDPVESACINCGRCLRACPMQLMPTLLDRCVRADRYDEAEKYGIMPRQAPAYAVLPSGQKGDYDPQEGGSREEGRGGSCKEGC